MPEAAPAEVTDETIVFSPLLMLFSNLAAFIMYYPKFESRYRLISIVFNSIPIICMALQILLPEVLFITMGAGMAGLILMSVLYRDQLEKYILQADLLSTQKASLLALQMRPHYIFNVLTSIYYICDQDPSKAQTTIADFTSYLRKNFTAMVSEDTINFADELEHVVVALVRLCEQQKMVQLRLAVTRERVVGGEIDLATVDGLDLEIRPGAGQLGVDRIARRAELRHAAHDPVVGDGDCGHFQLGGALDHVLHVGHAVEQRVFRMVMQVYKRHDLASS